ncbi:MAG TPA: hypothetical protein VGN26_17245 [Armatimonadota bacterium]|jgi:hypothetical protein
MGDPKTHRRGRIGAWTVASLSLGIGALLGVVTWYAELGPGGGRPETISGGLAWYLGIGRSGKPLDAVPWALLGLWWIGGLAMGLLIGRWLKDS